MLLQNEVLCTFAKVNTLQNEVSCTFAKGRHNEGQTLVSYGVHDQLLMNRYSWTVFTVMCCMTGGARMPLQDIAESDTKHSVYKLSRYNTNVVRIGYDSCCAHL